MIHNTWHWIMYHIYKKGGTEMENKFPFRYANGKFPGFIGLTKDQYVAVKNHLLFWAMCLGISYDDYMSLLYKDYPKA